MSELYDDDHTHAGPGHNGHSEPVQWQTPHLPEAPNAGQNGDAGEADLDLVEAAFIEGFSGASDPTSFLRLSGVPFVATGGDGSRLTLLRVETAAATDIGLLTPHLGGDGFRYAPLPAKLVETRKSLCFVYHDGVRLVPLTLAEARSMGADLPST